MGDDDDQDVNSRIVKAVKWQERRKKQLDAMESAVSAEFNSTLDQLAKVKRRNAKLSNVAPVDDVRRGRSYLRNPNSRCQPRQHVWDIHHRLDPLDIHRWTKSHEKGRVERILQQSTERVPKRKEDFWSAEEAERKRLNGMMRDARQVHPPSLPPRTLLSWPS